MTTEATCDPFEEGRIRGQEDGVTHPLTEAQERHVRTLLRQAEIDTPAAKAS